MALQLGDTAPDFEADSSEGRISFHDWLGDLVGGALLAPEGLHTGLHDRARLHGQDQARVRQARREVIGLSVDPSEDHEGWARDIEETQGYAPNYPIIGDADFNVSKLYGMLPATPSGDAGSRTPADNQTVRNVFVIGPDKKIKLILSTR